jgi:hypothetical protein
VGVLERKPELEDDVQEVVSVEVRREFTGLRILSTVEVL